MTETTTQPCPVCGGPSEPARRPDFYLLRFGLTVHSRRCTNCDHLYQVATQMTCEERERAKAGRFAKTEAPARSGWLPEQADWWYFNADGLDFN